MASCALTHFTVMLPVAVSTVHETGTVAPTVDLLGTLDDTGTVPLQWIKRAPPPPPHTHTHTVEETGTVDLLGTLIDTGTLPTVNESGTVAPTVNESGTVDLLGTLDDTGTVPLQWIKRAQCQPPPPPPPHPPHSGRGRHGGSQKRVRNKCLDDNLSMYFRPTQKETSYKVLIVS